MQISPSDDIVTGLQSCRSAQPNSTANICRRKPTGSSPKALSKPSSPACRLTMPVTFLPVEKVGYSVEHTNRPGCETYSWDEAIHRWIAIGESLADKGIRKLVMLNAHGGNSP